MNSKAAHADSGSGSGLILVPCLGHGTLSSSSSADRHAVGQCKAYSTRQPPGFLTYS